MNKMYQKSFPDNKNAGFTLIELLVVVLIVGILAAIALPQYQKAVAKARFSQLELAGKTLKESMEDYYMANGEYPMNWEDLVLHYPGCIEKIGRWLLVCNGWVTDMFYGAHANLVLWDIKDQDAIDQALATGYISPVEEKATSRYVVWLDHSESPGKRECSSQINGLCASMGY